MIIWKKEGIIVKKTGILNNKKFKLNKKTLVVDILFAVVLCVVYAVLYYYVNNLSVAVSSSETSIGIDLQNKIKMIEAIKDIVLIVLSLFISSLLASLLEINGKNDFTNDLIVNDVLSSPELLNMMTEENRIKILKNVECSYYFNGNDRLEDMFSEVKNTLIKKSDEQNVFFDNCEVEIRCKIKDNYIEKRIIKTVDIKSYNEKFDLKRYPLVGCTICKDINYTPLELKTVKVNGRDYSEQKGEIKREESQPEVLDRKSGYDSQVNYVLEKTIKVSDKKSTKIRIEYLTRVPLNDLIYTFRVKYPCKNFRLSFYLESQDEYFLKTIAFGFADDATDKELGFENDKKSVKISFDNWIFPFDGVAVFISKK